MRFGAKNKIAILLLTVLIVPILTVGLILPRLQFVSELAGGGDLKTGIYDVYLADYSKDPDIEDVNRFTIKLLLELDNPYEDQKIIIPRLSVELKHLDKIVGRIWTLEELVLEPFVNKDAHSAGLLPIYATFYIGKDSGLADLINEVLKGNLGSIELDLTVYLGDVPIQIDVLLGDLLPIFAGEGGELDLMSLLDMLGGEGGGDTGGISLGSLTGGEDFLFPDDYLFLYNTSVEDELKVKHNDIRALINIGNYSILTDLNDRLMFGAENKFDKIHWENGKNSNSAKGNGSYTWQYWAGNNWLDFPVQPIVRFNQTMDINFNQDSLSGWSSKQMTDFWDQDYYYVQCRVDSLDSGVDISDVENATYITMAVNESYINNYDTPSSSANSFSTSSNEKSQTTNVKLQAEKIKYPELKDYDIPVEKGLLKTDMDLETYLAANGVTLSGEVGDDIVNTWIIPALQRGYEKMAKTENIYVVNKAPNLDVPANKLDDLNYVIFSIMRFVYSHNLDPFEFISKCDLDFIGMIKFVAERFSGWSAPDGIDTITGEDIYLPISKTQQYVNSISYSFVILIIGIIAIGILAPYFANKRADQSFIYKDIKNLDKYIDKVKKEMEKGITEEEIGLLKKATLKEKALSDIKKPKEKGGA